MNELDTFAKQKLKAINIAIFFDLKDKDGK